MSTDTPRTDAELSEICEGNNSFGYVRIGHARQLERELTAANAEIARLKADKERLAQRLRGLWTQTPPTEQGTYWHWNGDEDCAPLPIFVLWSGFSGKCFVSQGQLGLTHAIDCDQYGGWWLPLYAPPLPNHP